MKTFQTFLVELTNAELARQYDNLEQKHTGLDHKTDLETTYGKDVRAHASTSDVYGKHHRPGIDFIHDPDHANHPHHETAGKLGYKYNSSHMVMGKPYHIYSHQTMKDVGVRNMGLTTNKHNEPTWHFNDHIGQSPKDLEKKVNGHVQYIRKKNGLKKVPGITS